MTSVFFQNFGCRVNQAEAFAWAEALQRGGLRLERGPERSDLIVVNTCTLTHRAESDVRRFLRKAVRINPAAGLVLTGCSIALGAERFADWPQVRLVVPNADKDRLPERVLGLVGASSPVPAEPFRSRALLKVQDGCDCRCSFCIIPSVRGRGRSLPPDDVRARVRRFAEQGFAEVVLSGVHLASYGTDLSPRASLAGLLEALESDAAGIPVRLSSLDPRFLTDDLPDRISASRILRPHFHLSFQSGADAVLEAMGRRMPAARFGEILDRLAAAVPDGAFGADMLVGFPGETDEDFERTIRFVEASPLTYCHVFSYSARAGTPAAVRPQVAPGVKKARSARLRDLAGAKNLAFRRRLSGRAMEGVVVRRRGAGGEVLTENYIKVRVPSGLPEARSRVRVEIVGASAAETEGRVARS
ncbi:MAG: MiaB/RimO family radical SAM methylthiotransferase [Candidatus Aminicenantes bacterium]|nr:MiaB/RimO family radical SAM methylthiotransferase [Candidatus Aminicenantes bacterium]